MYPEQLQNTKFCFKDHMERVLGLGRASFGLKWGFGEGGFYVHASACGRMYILTFEN